VFDTPAELLEKIRLGEDSFLDLKEVRFSGERVAGPRRDEFSDEVASFANAKGGVCLLGVDDKSREIIGIPIDRLDTVESFVREVLNDIVKPPLPATIERMTLPSTTGTNEPVIKITIDPSLFVHRSAGGYFHRIGSSKREMAPDYLARLFQQRSQSRMIRFDEEIVAGADLSDLDESLYRRFRTDRTIEDEDASLQQLGIARKKEPGGTLRPTVAGLLLASPAPERHLANAYIQAVAYRGETIGASSEEPYQLDASDITGPLDQQVIDACRFVYRNMRTSATKHVGRADLPQYDIGAVFEAVVNAVAHRDYSMYGSKVRLRMFSNRIELYSPGALPNTMDVASLPYRQAARNETITSLLAKCAVPRDVEWLQTSRSTMMDRRGEGVSLILRNSERLSGRMPEYLAVDDSELRLTIYAAVPRPESD
jgi:predicted HTH transcriptional regulator